MKMSFTRLLIKKCTFEWLAGTNCFEFCFTKKTCILEELKSVGCCSSYFLISYLSVLGYKVF
jgi:hypothetical protein